jgi:hypothetical protein
MTVNAAGFSLVEKAPHPQCLQPKLGGGSSYLQSQPVILHVTRQPTRSSIVGKASNFQAQRHPRDQLEACTPFLTTKTAARMVFSLAAALSAGKVAHNVAGKRMLSDIAITRTDASPTQLMEDSGHTATVFGATGQLGRYIVNRLGPYTTNEEEGCRN